MKRPAFIIVAILLVLGIVQLPAQDKRKKGKEKPKDAVQAPASNDAADAEPDADIPGRDTGRDVRYYLFPQFYSYWPVANDDTILKYECFDINHKPIIIDTLTNTDVIQFIWLVKTYKNYLKTYIDPDGKPGPQPVSRTLFTFEKTGTDTWKCVDLATNTSYSLLEHKEKILRRDTTIVANPVTGSKQLTIREYYKITDIEGSESVEAGGNRVLTDDHPYEIKYYTVPEFYFHWPKKSRDTVFEFKCYDERDSVIANVENFDSVRFFSLFKSFIDSTHSYRDDDGKQKPLPVSVIVKRYDHTGRDKWMSVEYPSNRFTNLKGFKEVIVRVDTEAIVDPVTDHAQMRIFRHYRVIKN